MKTQLTQRDGLDLVQRNKTIAILKSVKLPFILTDTVLNSSRIRQSDCVIRYWFDHVLTIRSNILILLE